MRDGSSLVDVAALQARSSVTMSEPGNWKSRQETLLWLNDRTGRMAQLTVLVGLDAAFPPSAAQAVASVTGRLTHWRDAIPVESWMEVEQTGDHSGSYKIGTGVLSLPPDARASESAFKGLEVLYVPLAPSTGAYLAIGEDNDPIFGGE